LPPFNSCPLVSIITPSYNQAAYIEATLQSVLRQDYPAIEYLVVDGGSTDGSVEIIERYAGSLAWWVSEPDGGQADAINKGFRRARGEVVAWLNSDDLYLPGAVSEAVAALDADPSLSMVFGDAVSIDAAGRPFNAQTFGEWGLTELMRFQIICQPAVFMRRSALEQAGLLDERFHFMLDHHLWLRIATASPIKHLPRFWAAARYHPAAKNVSQADAFADEIYRLADFLRTDPHFSARFAADRRRVLAGAHDVAGRYLLDGGLPAQALRAYARSFLCWPGGLRRIWGRMAFALVNLAGLGNLENWRRRKPPRLDDPRLGDWPGLTL